MLSDTGLGKETHSVISQGRVEAIVTSKPRDRRLLIEEAAGLGKHRKRRRRAQLKLERTQENLDRALDVEREARTRLRPLKRQAEAAELHERLERQMLQARWELACERARATRWSSTAPSARSPRRARRARRSKASCRRRSSGAAQPSGRWPSAPSATTRCRAAAMRRARRGERLQLRAEQVGCERAGARAARIERVGARAASARRPGRRDGPPTRRRSRRMSGSALLEAELAELEATREQEIEREIAELEAELRPPAERLAAGRGGP